MRVTSKVGMPSVMATTSFTPASAASKMASAAKGAGTKMIDALAWVSSTASNTVSNTGTPSTSWPPLPGAAPATMLVPSFRIAAVWNLPLRPVMF